MAAKVKFRTDERYRSGLILQARVAASTSGVAVDFSSDFVRNVSGSPAAIDISNSVLPVLVIQNCDREVWVDVQLDKTGRGIALAPGQAIPLRDFDTSVEVKLVSDSVTPSVFLGTTIDSVLSS